MARLPVPGSDDGAWGALLNDFLLVGHREDGTLRAGQAGALLVAAADSSAESKLAANFVCDGTADQVQINAAVAALGPAGGTIQLSEGTFNCSGAVRLSRRTQLQGRGRATILKANGSWSAFDGSAQGALIEPADDGTDKTAVAHLALDGNRWSGGDCLGIYYNITRSDAFDEGPDAAHQFVDVYIYRTRRHGIHLTGAHMRANQLARLRVYNVGEEGVTEAHSFLIDCPDSFLSQCESGSSSGSGFYVAGSNNRFVGCKSWYSDLNGFSIHAVRNQFAACEAQDNEGHGFYCGSGPNSFVGCHADSNSWNGASPTSSFDGFHIPWGSRIQLVGCSAYDKNEGGRGHWQRYGFFIGSSAEHIQIIGTVMDNATAGVGGSGAGNASNLILVNG
ncbi:MAG: right-handed parallel beta-helix repeat-containing protein [Anaerolineales bacterium]|nr:right-handed parallel beta-helix repeat-containing protein [Anaerolineales bacterium]